MSNRERIARAAEEARLTELEKAAKKSAKATTGSATKRAPKVVRMKIVWEVSSGGGKALKTFAYADKAAAEAEMAALTKSTGRAHSFRAAKVPMD